MMRKELLNVIVEFHLNNIKKTLNHNIICDCGGVLKEKLLNIGELNYSSSNECIHNKNGCDYLYKKRTIISYTCEKCNSYFEVDIYDNQLECNGI